MVTSNRGVKKLVFETVTFTNNLDDKGNKKRRSELPKMHFAAADSISKKLNQDQEVLFGTPEVIERVKTESFNVSEEFIAEMGGWKPFSDVTDANQGEVIAVRYTENELEFTDKEKAAIKVFWKEFDEVGAVGIEAFEELEALLA